MTDRPVPAPRRWKNALWRRLDGRFAQKGEVERLAAQTSDLVVRLAELTEVREALNAVLAQSAERQTLLIARLDEIEARLGDLQKYADSKAERIKEQALGDTQDISAISVMLAPNRPLPPLGGWALAPDAARYLVETVLQTQPEHVIECGSGSSTVLIAMAMERVGNGLLTTMEHDLDYLRRTEELLGRHGLRDRVELAHTPLERVEVDGLAVDWYRLPDGWRGQRTFDLVLVDGPPSTGKLDRYPALPLLRPFLSDRAVLLIDDVSRPDEETMVELWEGRYPEFVAERLQHSKGTAVLRRRPGSQPIQPDNSAGSEASPRY